MQEIRDTVEARLGANTTSVLPDSVFVGAAGKPYLFIDVVGMRLEANWGKDP